MSDQIQIDYKSRAEQWGNVAPVYDHRWSTLEGSLYAQLEASIITEYLQAAPGKRILDVCCGTGRNTLAVARSGAQLVGVDAAAEMLAVARQKAVLENIHNVSFVRANVGALPFESESFDGVTGVRFMYMMSRAEKRTIIEELQRVLKPSGILALQFNGWLWGLKHEALNALTGKNPFRLQDRYLWPGQAAGLFESMHVDGVTGIKLPWLGKFAKLCGNRTALGINQCVRWPCFRYLSAYLVVKAVKRLPKS